MSTPKPSLPSRKSLLEARDPLRQINQDHKNSLSRLDRAAVWVTDHIGTPGFFLLIFSWTTLWLGWNLFAPANLKFDPPKAFALWLFLSNLIQIFLMPLIMIGQNLQAQHAELRAESDFEVNVKAEREIDAILLHLEWQNQLLENILTRLEQIEKGKNS